MRDSVEDEDEFGGGRGVVGGPVGARSRACYAPGDALYITYENGRGFGHKELRFHDMAYIQGSNLTRERIDYGELHCQLVEVEPTLRLGAFDENILEVGEVDSGLTWAKAGYSMWFTPWSVVHYRLRGPIAAEDIRLFDWRWNMRSIRKGFLYFEQKWNSHISERGQFRYFLLRYNSQLGLLPRMFPSTLALRVENALVRLLNSVVTPLWVPHRLLSNLRAWRIGYFDWPSGSAD